MLGRRESLCDGSGDTSLSDSLSGGFLRDLGLADCHGG